MTDEFELFNEEDIGQVILKIANDYVTLRDALREAYRLGREDAWNDEHGEPERCKK